MSIRPGQRIRFLYTIGDQDVFAGDLGKVVDPALLNKARYIELLAKAGGSVLLPFGIDPKLLMEWSVRGGVQLMLKDCLI